MITYLYSVPGGSDSKASACNVGDQGSVSRSGRSPGEGNGYPLKYSCLENSMARGAHRYHTIKECSVRPCWASLRDIQGLILHQGTKSVCLMTHELPFTLKHKSFATFYNNRRALYRKIKSFQRKVFYYSTKLRTEERKALHYLSLSDVVIHCSYQLQPILSCF